MIWTAVLKFLKAAWPFLLAGAVYYIAFLQGSAHGQQKAHKDFIEQVAKLDKKKCPDCRCNCPEQKPCPDFDKIKGKNITLHVHTSNMVMFDQDSLASVLIKKEFSDIVKTNLEALEVVRAKKR